MNNDRKLSAEEILRLVKWLEPSIMHRMNRYPCPRCGRELPQYGQGIHVCGKEDDSGIPPYRP